MRVVLGTRFLIRQKGMRWAFDKSRGTSLQDNESKWLRCRHSDWKTWGEKIKAFYIDCIYSLPQNKRQDHCH